MTDANASNSAFQYVEPYTTLPNITSIRSQIRKYTAPKLRNFKSYAADFKQVLEVIATVDGPMPIQGDSPMLYIGETVAQESEAIDDLTYRFLWFNWDNIKEGQPIILDWLMKKSDEKKSTKFYFKLDK